MTGTKDLLEAHGHARRRLVAAFLRGVPDGDPPALGAMRATVLGLVLAGLLVGGAAAYGFLWR